MLSLKKRVIIFLLLWLIVAVAFTFAPAAPTDYPQNQERFQAFVSAPLMFAFGLASLFSESETAHQIVFVSALLYVSAQVGYFLTQEHRRQILIFRTSHLILTGLAIVGLVKFTWNSVAG